LKEFRLRLNEKEIRLLLYALLKAFGEKLPEDTRLEVQGPRALYFKLKWRRRGRPRLIIRKYRPK